MNRILFLLFLACSAFGQTRYVTDLPDPATACQQLVLCTNADFGGFKGMNAADPTNPQEVATKHYVDSLGGGGTSANWSTNPAVSDVDMGAKNLLNASVIQASQFHSGFTVWQNDEIDSSSGSSTFWISPDANFGLHNGESAGVGADVHLVSENGGVFVSPYLGFIGTGAQISASNVGTTTLFVSGTSTVDMAGNLLNVGTVAATDSLIASAGNIRCDAGFILAGLISDDGTGALIQSSGDISAGGSYWAGGAQGISTTITVSGTNFVFTGGLLTGHTP